jgi:tetratricopeptide (TPR) repeat protein
LTAAVPPPEPEEAEAVQALQSVLARAKAHREGGDYDAALAAVRRADAALEDLAYEPVRAGVWYELSAVHDARGEYPEAEAALWRAQRQGAIDKQWDVVRDATVALMFVLGLRQERHAEALALRELATGLCLGSPLAEARLNDNIGGVLLAQGRREPAEAEYRAALARWHEALGPDDPKVAAARSNLGNVLYIRGEYERAAAEYRAALAVAQRTLGPDHPEVAMYRSNLGEALRARKMYREAEVEQRLALAVRERALGDDHPDVASSHNNLGAALEMQGEYEAAEAEFRAALAIHQRALGADHSYVALTRANLADVLKAQGRLEEAQIEEAKLEKAKLKEAEAKQHVELAH